MELLQPNLTKFHLGVSFKIKNNPFENYVIKIISFQRHNELFDWSEIEDSILTWDKNHFTEVSHPT